jgi:hypothetical protein
MGVTTFPPTTELAGIGVSSWMLTVALREARKEAGGRA